MASAPLCHHGLTVAGKAHPLGFDLAAKIPCKPYRAGGSSILPSFRSRVAADGDGDIGPGQRQNTGRHLLNARFADGAVYRQGFRANLQHVALGFIAEGDDAGIIKRRGIRLSTERRRQIATGAGLRRGQSPARAISARATSAVSSWVFLRRIDLVCHSDPRRI
jgi:hypothetical protein